MEDNILELNSFISYDIKKEKFIIKEHTIKIEAQEFSMNDLGKSNKTKRSDYKAKLKQLKEE